MFFRHQRAMTRSTGMRTETAGMPPRSHPVLIELMMSMQRIWMATAIWMCCLPQTMMIKSLGMKTETAGMPLQSTPPVIIVLSLSMRWMWMVMGMWMCWGLIIMEIKSSGTRIVLVAMRH